MELGWGIESSGRNGHCEEKKSIAPIHCIPLPASKINNNLEHCRHRHCFVALGENGYLHEEEQRLPFAKQMLD